MVRWRIFLLFLILILTVIKADAQQQDVDFHLSGHLLAGKNIIKIKRDAQDLYLWALGSNNDVYRINSQTNQVDDYTASFAAFKSKPLIDIAGINKDTVFVASASELILCINGIAVHSPVTEQIASPINSLVVTGGTEVLIGTDKNLFAYDIAYDNFRVAMGGSSYALGTNHSYWVYATIDSRYPAELQTIAFDNGYGAYAAYIYKTGTPSQSLPYTGYVRMTDLYSNYFANIYWGNANGLFQISYFKESYNVYYNTPYKQYLNGHHVNKVTSVRGFADFAGKNDLNGKPIPVENFVVGTDSGFYFSSTVYNNYDYTNALDSFKLFRSSIIPTTHINDICVFLSKVDNNLIGKDCEGPLYFGTNDGIYILSTDYISFFDTERQVKMAYFDTPDNTPTSSISICPATSVRMYVNNASNDHVQWQKDGIDIPGATQNDFQATMAGDYNAIIYDPCSSMHISTNHLKVSLLTDPVFTFNYPDKYQVCDADQTTLQVESSPSYHYRWYRQGTFNGVDTTAQISVMSDGKYRVEVSSCSGKWISSKEIEVNLIGMPPPQIDLDKDTWCEGEAAVLRSNVPTDPSYTIDWYLDGVLLPQNKNKTQINVTKAGNYTLTFTSTVSPACVHTSYPQPIHFISAPAFTFNYPDKLQLCDAQSTVLQVDQNASYNYRWYKDGTLNGNITYQQTVTQSGKYKVEVSACSGTWIASKDVQIDLVNMPAPQITADKDTWCQGDIAVLKANVPVDASYMINWYLDGTLLPEGTNQTQLNANKPGNYTLTLTSTIKADCVHTSNGQQLTFITGPVFTLNYPEVINKCDGETVTLTAQGSSSYQYRWYKDGQLNGNTTNAISINQGGSYRLEASACQGNWVTSKAIQVNFVKLPTPVIKTDKPAYCINDVATLSLNISADPNYTISWLYNNAPLSQNRTSIQATTSGNYSVVVSSNLVSCTQTSAQQIIEFTAPPVISIRQVVNTTLCQGQTVTLVADHSAGSAVKWSTGETTDQINVTASGSYTVTATTAAGCTATDQNTVNFLPNPVLSVPDAGVCTFTKQSVTLTAPTGFARYSWDNQDGSQTYEVSKPQQVTLTVTDNNGCQATQQINVINQCPDVHIPNAFTPNGDGINDTWNLFGLDGDATVTVRVYNRYGGLVYQTSGAITSWDGKASGKRLPAGTYYYIITAKGGTQTFSGWVGIVY